MPGKRPRQIQRTPSMSLLGGADRGCFTMGARFSRTAPESFLKYAGPSFPEDAASLHRELSPPPRQELLDHMQICTGATNVDALIIEDALNNMSIDGSIEESLLASHATHLDALYPGHQPLYLGQTCTAQLGVDVHQSAQSGHMNSLAHSKSMAFFRGHVAPGSAQPVHFLDACFLCSKRLGHGRDVFIYRGDRAFCSEECRHSQILADERREKFGRTVVKERVGVNNAASDASSSTGQVETAAA